MTIQDVKDYLDSIGLKNRVLEFASSSATVELAAEQVGCLPCHIAKTMGFWVDDVPVLIVMAGDARIDNPKFKATFHQKARMIGGDQVLDATGWPVGGVCPFLAKEGNKVYLDQSLQRFEEIYPAAGTPNSAVRLNLQELENAIRCCGWVDISKLPEAQ